MTLVKSALSAGLAAIILAGSAAAQTPPTMPSAPSMATGARFDAFGGTDRRDFERNRADMTEQREEAAQADPERLALAERIAALVEEGKCAEARRAANDAGDRQMALRVRQTCRAR